MLLVVDPRREARWFSDDPLVWNLSAFSLVPLFHPLVLLLSRVAFSVVFFFLLLLARSFSQILSFQKIGSLVWLSLVLLFLAVR